ncbi:unnamed protein product [Mytilus coruscus]|uniref:Uncharacterized protein n=1 Tax=Mytilus coruscus TaxID=42192 RepID=A0A6J8BQ43_MYTCO|nr:unnamed protein product [Mytilus coruscus]
MAYLGLYIGIRSRNWNLRNVSLKKLACLFYAYDRHNYLRMIPYHLADLQTFPQSVLDHFEAGCFSVSITTKNYYCVALDEAHETCEMEINLKNKQAINTFSQTSLASLTYYLSYRAEALHNIKNQLCIEKSDSQYRETNKPFFETEELTIRHYLSELNTTLLFQENSECPLIAFSKHTQKPVTDLDQFISLPRAISDSSGQPLKGTKSNVLKVIKSTYEAAFLSSLPVIDDSVQSTVILEEMFLINTIPLSSHRTFIDYTEFLFDRWVVKSHNQFKAQEIHVVFDHPKRNEKTYNTVSSDVLLPYNWRNFLNVRDHKRKLVNYLSYQFITLSLQRFQNHECVVVTAGGFDAVNVDKALGSLGAGDGSIVECCHLNSNHEEDDTRHRTAFQPASSVKEMYDKTICESALDKHVALIKDFRERMLECVMSEVEMIPNAEALKLHWLRCCWVASVSTVNLPTNLNQAVDDPDSDSEDSEHEEDISYDCDSETDINEFAADTSGNTSTAYINYWDTFENYIFALPTD